MIKILSIFLILGFVMGCTLSAEQLSEISSLESNTSAQAVVVVNASNKQIVIDDVTRDITTVASDLDSLAESI